MKNKLFIKKFMRVAVVIGVLIIPLLYSYLYLGAFQDPYSRLGDIPFAVVNLDQGSTINGNVRNVGDEVCKTLKENATFHFYFTDLEDAQAGVKSNKYYAVLEFPADFTACIASASTANKTPAQVLYTVNEKHNFLAAQIVGQIIPRIELELTSTVDSEIVGELAGNIKGVPKSMEELSDGLHQLSDGSAQLRDGSARLASGVGQLDDGLGQLVDGITEVNEKTADLAALINKAAELGIDVSQLDQLFDGLQQIQGGLETAKAGSKTLNQASGQLSDGMAKLDDGINTAKDGVDSSIDSANSQLSTVDGLEEFAQEPVSTVKNAVFHTPDYGTAFAPYFLSLALWVGALMIYYGIYFDTETFDLLSENSRKKRIRMAVFLGISMLQAVFLAFIIQKELAFSVESLPLYYLSCILVSMTFFSIVQFFIMHLAHLGKFLTLFMLILQLTSCAGTFPVETVPGFFQALYPYMPMTYSVGLFKEAISGAVELSVKKNAVVLMCICLCFTLLSLAVNGLKTHKKRPASPAASSSEKPVTSMGS